MNIGIAGLGLIGGSLAKAIKAKTNHRIFGYDISDAVLKSAQDSGTIDGVLSCETIGSCELVIVALYPKDAVLYIQSNAHLFQKNAVVVDCCGVKRVVCDALKGFSEQNGFVYVGGHPMAGTERWGYDASRDNLFAGASMIVTPDDDTPEWALARLGEVFFAIGFRRLQRSTPEEHDFIIAFTSQLAHVISCAYIDTDSAKRAIGFSAGSFRDMTRVAYLNEDMWSELFMENADFLEKEVDGLLQRLSAYSAALKAKDIEAMRSLLKNSRETKETIDEFYAKEMKR